MNLYEYRKACSYARKLTDDYRDIVHDAFLDHHKRTGENLFDSPNRTIVVTVRNHYYNSIRRNRFMYKGEFFQKRHYRLDNDEKVGSGESTVREYIEGKFNLYSHSLMNELIYRDQIEKVNQVLTPIQIDVFSKLVQGYTIQDVAKDKGVNQSSVRKTSEVIKEKIKKLKL